MDTVALLIIEVLNGISSLALTCAGLAIIFGMMRVINFAHGEFMMLGGYTTVVATNAGVNIWISMLILSPIVVGIMHSTLSRPSYLPGRVDQMMYPAFCLLVAVGIGALAWRVPRLLLIGGMIAASAAVLWDHQRQDHSRGDRALARLVAVTATARDTIICTSATRLSLMYYLRRAGHGATILSFPPSTSEHLGYQDNAALLGDRAALIPTDLN